MGNAEGSCGNGVLLLLWASPVRVSANIEISRNLRCISFCFALRFFCFLMKFFDSLRLSCGCYRCILFALSSLGFTPRIVSSAVPHNRIFSLWAHHHISSLTIHHRIAFWKALHPISSLIVRLRIFLNSHFQSFARLTSHIFSCFPQWSVSCSFLVPSKQPLV